MRANQHTPLRVRFMASFVRADSGCWLWTGGTSNRRNGAKRPQINVNGRAVAAYRVSFELFNGPISPGHAVCHRCDVPMCVNPAHLFAGSNSDNMRDMVSKGRAADRRGEKCPTVKLTEAAVREILASDESQKDLALRFNVDKSTICAIKRRRIWAHVQ